MPLTVWVVRVAETTPPAGVEALEWILLTNVPVLTFMKWDGLAMLISAMPDEPLIIDKLMGELATKYADRASGYTRIVKIGPRLGDAAAIVQIELV